MAPVTFNEYKGVSYAKEKYNIFKCIFNINNVIRNRTILFDVEYIS